MATNMGFELSNLFRSENLKLVLSHSILDPPVIVFFQPLYILGPRCHSQSRNGRPWKASLASVGFPQALCGLRASGEDWSLDWAKIEGAMPNSGVPPRRV